MKRWGIVLVAALAVAAWGRREYRVLQEARAYLDVFASKYTGRTPEMARAINELAREPYLVRLRALQAAYTGYPTLYPLYYPPWPWDVDKLDRLKNDLVKWPCYRALPILDSLYPDDRIRAVCKGLILATETDSEKAWRWYQLHGLRGDAHPLEALRTFARRLHHRARHIEEEWIWPELVKIVDDDGSPRFWQYASREGRAKRRDYVIHTLIRHEDVEQALFLEPEIGLEPLRKIAEAQLDRFESAPKVVPPQDLGWGPIFPATPGRKDRLPASYNPSAAALARFEPALAVRATTLLLEKVEAAPVEGRSRIYDHGQTLGHFLSKLPDEHIEAAAPLVAAAWSRAEAMSRADALQPALIACARSWPSDQLTSAARRALTFLRKINVVERPYRGPEERARMTAALLALASRLDQRMPAAWMSLLDQSFQEIDISDSYFIDTILEGFSAVPASEAAHERMLPHVMQRLTAPDMRPKEWRWRLSEVLEKACAAVPESGRRAWTAAILDLFDNPALGGAMLPAAECLFALEAEPEALRWAQQSALRVFQSDAEAWTRNGALLALQRLGAAEASPRRKAELLEIALGGLEDLPWPGCDGLARLVAADELPMFARVLRLPTCLSWERSDAARIMLQAQGLPMEQFGNWPFMHPLGSQFEVDPILVARWLRERGL